MKTQRLLSCLLVLTLALGLGACQKTIKSGSGANGGVTDSESMDFGSLPNRPEGNPENADYEQLKAYTVYFDFDSFAINASERPKLEAVAKWMIDNPGANIVLAGHTDSRGTTQYNVGLGERRALATRDYLMGLGADGARLVTLSYGEERPADPSENESAWSKNRRCALGVMR